MINFILPLDLWENICYIFRVCCEIRLDLRIKSSFDVDL